MKYILLFLLLFININVQVFSQEKDSDGEEIDIQVVASKVPKRISETSADVTLITKEDLKANGAASVTDILRENGIVALDSHGSRRNGDQIYIQGMDSSRLLIVVDGQRVRDGSMGGISVLKRIPLSSIERIEIIKGASAFLWGSDAQSGVIYIQTKKGSGQQGFHGNLGTSYKNNFYLDNNNNFVRPYANLSYGWDGGSAWAGGSFEYGDNWASPYTIQNLPTPGEVIPYKIENERDDYINFDVYGGVGIDISEMHSLEVTAKYQQEKSPIREMLTTVDDNEFKKVMGNVSYSIYPTDSLDINISTGFSYDEENRTVHNQRIEDYYIFNDNEIFIAYYFNDIFTFKGGYTFDLEYFKESNIKSYNQQNHALFFGGDVDIDTVVDIDITAGVRYQLNLRDASGFSDTSPLHSVSPEFGIVLKPIDMLAIKGHVGHSFKVPDLIVAFRDYFDHTWFFAGPNPDLKPESSWGYSGAVEVYPLENMAFSAGIFRNDLKNLIAYDENTGEYYNNLPVYKPINIGKAYTWGVNASANAVFEIPMFGTLDYNFNFEYLLAAKEISPEDEQYISTETGERFNPNLPYRPVYTLSGSISWYKKEWGTTLKVSGYYFAQGYEYEEDNSRSGVYTEKRTPAMSSLDLRIAQEIPPFIVYRNIESIVYFEVKNLLNSVYDDDYDGDTDRPERHFIVGFDMSF